VKTDVIDSKKLALELSRGTLRGIYQRLPQELLRQESAAETTSTGQASHTSTAPTQSRSAFLRN
jgi:hypothetical protein